MFYINKLGPLSIAVLALIVACKGPAPLPDNYREGPIKVQIENSTEGATIQQVAQSSSVTTSETPHCVPEDEMAMRWLQNSKFASQFLPAVVEQDLWDRVVSGYTLPMVVNPRIEKQKKWFLSNPQYMNRASRRAARYLHYVVGELERHEMPLELALLPVVESAYDPFAYSHGHAAGLWQFISATGKRYNMRQNWWYDGRRDIVASTQGAISYLKDMHTEFNGDWLLALAAYNAGEGKVRKALRRNRRAGKPIDFWSLQLPSETRQYVPRLIAIAELAKGRARNKVVFNAIPDRQYFSIVNIGSQLDLAQAAALGEISTEEIYLLNPAFNRWATPPTGPHRLLVPTGNAEQFSTSLHALPNEQRLSWQRYTIQAGDTLSGIANTFHTTVATIKTTNNLKSNRIRSNRTLLIPAALQSAAQHTLSHGQRQQRKVVREAGTAAPQLYTVQAGDSFWSIARAHNVSVASLARWNHMVPRDVLRKGQTLSIIRKAK